MTRIEVPDRPALDPWDDPHLTREVYIAPELLRCRRIFETSGASNCVTHGCPWGECPETP